MKTNILRSYIALATVVALSGCLKSPENTAPLTPQTHISVMHLAPTAPDLDVYFDNDKVSGTPFGPGNVTPIYNSVNRGTFLIKFKKATADSLVAQVPMALYDSMKYYTLFIYNLQANGPANAIRIIDDFSEVQANLSKPYYRFFHASPNAGAADIYIDNVKVESGRTNADNTQLEVLNKFLGTTPGFHSVQVKLAGTDTVLASNNTVELLAGNAYTIYLKGLAAGTGANQLSIGILRAAD